MTESKELIVVEKAIAETFGTYKDQISQLKEDGLKTVFDYENPKGEKEARSFIYKHRQMKSAIDKAHKTGKSQYLKITQAFDKEKRSLTAECEAVIEYHDKPLRDIEVRRKEESAAKALAAEQAEWDAAVIADFERAFDEATAEDDLINREREIKAKEDELARIEAERVAKEEAEKEAEAARLKTEQEDKEKAEYEAKLKEEAAEKARWEAEDKAKAEQALAKFLADWDTAIAMNQTFDLEREQWRANSKAYADKEAAEELVRKTEQDRIEAARKEEADRVEADRKAEQRRLDDIQAANAKAARELAEAEAKKQTEIDRLKKVESDRVAEENRKLAEQKRRDEDKAHRGDVNRAIVEKFTELIGCGAESGQRLVKAILLGEIDNIKITY